ncbi:polyadenylate-binding protein [Moesziomyces antarcticus T-34]|uniref:Polyadenylate-binding protein n=1 Tax=Pseudozyma antarctica (strain T-34) TaxID=1151754 RepID=M9M1R3_PSEA3|nr:polyadenylate-binding protein [Moesziomyces antarcticus T-34]
MSEFTISSIRAVVAREPSATPGAAPSASGVIDLTPVKEEVKPEPVDILSLAGDVAMRGDADGRSVEIVNTRASVEAVEPARVARHATPSLRIARARSRSRSVHPYVRSAPLVRAPTPAARPAPLMRTPTPAPRLPRLAGIQVEDEVTLVATNHAAMLRNAAATARQAVRDQRRERRTHRDTAMTRVSIEVANGSVISKTFLVPTGAVTAGKLEMVANHLQAAAERKLGGTRLPRAMPRN